jgi:hypothetical protein
MCFKYYYSVESRLQKYLTQINVDSLDSLVCPQNRSVKFYGQQASNKETLFKLIH